MKKGFILAFISLALVSLSFNASAQVERFKALYVYNICKLVEWPANYGNDVFTVGVVGNDQALISNLKSTLGTKSVNGKSVKIISVKNSNDANNCNVLYFVEGKEKLISDIGPGATRGLIISETTGATTKGSGINFFLQGSKLKFELKEANIIAKGLNMSNQLASLAAKTL